MKIVVEFVGPGPAVHRQAALHRVRDTHENLVSRTRCVTQ